MLQTCGINPKLTINMKERLSYLPNGKGSYSYYKSKKLWRLLINSNDLQLLLLNGFNCKRLVINKRNIQRKAAQFIKVTNIVDNSRIDNTYCFYEPKRNAGIFNGIITSQCTEIIEYSSPTEYAVCNLASLGLTKYVKDDRTFDFDKLIKVTKIVTRNLNKIIDVNFYPVPETERSNKLHRPIGIGVQGLADVFAKMKLPFDSAEAKELNKLIFETIYFGALTASCELAKEREEKLMEYIEYRDNPELYENIMENTNEYDEMLTNMEKELYIIPEELERDEYIGTYSSYIDSPVYNGELQFDMWGTEPELHYDWDTLRIEIKQYGIRNSLLLAPMPTASTSQILGNNECFEPFTSNIYLRRTLAGEFVVINKYLIEDLLKIKMWNVSIKNEIIKNNGSIQNINGIPEKLKKIYKITWEISNKTLIDMAADRGQFICQSQSLNLFTAAPDFAKLSKMHFYSWKKGLKTGIYYLRTRPVAKAQQFTIEPENKNNANDTNKALEKELVALACNTGGEPACEMCSA